VSGKVRDPRSWKKESRQPQQRPRPCPRCDFRQPRLPNLEANIARGNFGSYWSASPVPEGI
jgi:hypothetical protein